MLFKNDTHWARDFIAGFLLMHSFGPVHETYTLFHLFSGNNLPSIRTQCPVTIQTKTNAEEQTSDIASAGVTRPQKPT